ncbi:hypothetical protein AVEN_11873-1 [Araneus ventricosus]|uniref:Uncharacterized protein n=1 Tax=Araneus ventricosus TaxID=182803 RepID=A0A4Y2NGE1_ARAVE|nr:hypothetical protein AVEN_11873-1 [Araneus ventricosus]
MRGQYAQAANKHIMKIGSSVDYVRSGVMRNVPVTKIVTTAKFSGCELLASCPAYSYPPRRHHEGYFGMDLVSLEPRSDDEDGAWAGTPPSPGFRTTPLGENLTPLRMI